MVVAVCCLLAIFITLAKFNRQEQPDWLYARTLNLSTLIALLATVLRWMLENVLEAGQFMLIFFLYSYHSITAAQVLMDSWCLAGIGQLKWRWFQTSSRPLHDMSIYEDASRSIWGSLVFLFSLPRMYVHTSVTVEL